MKTRYVKPGEYLALTAGGLQQDRKGFFWMFGGGGQDSERIGDTTVIHVRGELEHHQSSWGCESYEDITQKFRDAFSGQDVVKAHERKHQYDDDFAPIEATKPARIVMCIDSPGGVVSGLFECVSELQRLKAQHQIPVVCYVNEMAASAAYALACACDQIVCPPTAILGSIGVISTMVSAAARDKKEGFDVRLITSGDRKADGHMHAPLTDGAVAAETKRVGELALAFFRLVAKSRKLSVDRIRGFQAGIYLGNDAMQVGLADRVVSYSDLLAEAHTKVGTNVNLTAAIKSTKAALAREKDPAKRRSLQATLASYNAALAAYKKTEKTEKHMVTEEDDSEAEGGDEPAEAEGGDEPAEAEGGDEPAEAEGDDEPTEATAASSDDEDEEDEDEEDEAKSAKKALALVQSLTGMKGKKALGALQAIAMTASNAAKDVAALRKEQSATAKANLISGARGKYLTKAEASWLATQPMVTVKGFVEMRRKAGIIVHTDDTTIVKPAAAKPGSEESLPQEVRDIIDAAMAGVTGDKEKARAELVAAHLKAHHDMIARASNGAGRY